MTPLENLNLIRKTLIHGRQQLDARFGRANITLKAGESFAARARGSIYRLQIGWVCQFRDLPNGRRAIIDVYLPGDIIGLDARFGTRPLANVLALTSVDAQVIDAESGLHELMASQSVGLYIAWALGCRQRRADRLLTAMSCSDARGRLGIMVLDFHRRLRARKLISANSYNMPLTQQHIGNYLGLTVVHVNRVLRSLRDDRIASLERGWMTILDLERLTALAGECGTSGTTSNRAPSDTAPPVNQVSEHGGLSAAASAL